MLVSIDSWRILNWKAHSPCRSDGALFMAERGILSVAAFRGEILHVWEENKNANEIRKWQRRLVQSGQQYLVMQKRSG